MRPLRSPLASGSRNDERHAVAPRGVKQDVDGFLPENIEDDLERRAAGLGAAPERSSIASTLAP